MTSNRAYKRRNAYSVEEISNAIRYYSKTRLVPIVEEEEIVSEEVETDRETIIVCGVESTPSTCVESESFIDVVPVDPVVVKEEVRDLWCDTTIDLC